MLKPFRIWVLEDDSGSQFVYEQILKEVYHLRFFARMQEFRAALVEGADQLPELIIADIHLPDESFLNFLDSEEADILLNFPFIVVSSYDDMSALRYCFDKGALDFMTKPFNKSELIVKIERILSSDNLPKALDHRKVLIDHTSFAILNGAAKSAPLTSKELQIVSMIVQAPNQTQTKEEILGKIWGNVKVGTNTLDVHLFNLRKKLEPIGLRIVFIAPNLYRLLSSPTKPMSR